VPDKLSEAKPDHYKPEADYGAADYMRLPDFGKRHYSLTDAGLVAALDIWSSGKAPQMPPLGFEDAEGVMHADQSSPKIRAALEPLREQLVSALMQSAESGQLKVVVRGRNLSDSRPIPERTFVDALDLIDWLRVHGHERGDILADIEECLYDNPWQVASAVAEERAQLRLEHLEPDPTGEPLSWEEKWQRLDLHRAERKLRENRLHIVHLEQQLDAARGGAGSRKPLSSRERRTFLIIIAALCQKAGIKPDARGAAVVIASATEQLGVPVSDDSIRTMLREIPDAIDSRSR
jgi:hypothetical protein